MAGRIGYVNDGKSGIVDRAVAAVTDAGAVAKLMGDEQLRLSRDIEGRLAQIVDLLTDLDRHVCEMRDRSPAIPVQTASTYTGGE